MFTSEENRGIIAPSATYRDVANGIILGGGVRVAEQYRRGAMLSEPVCVNVSM